MPTVAYEEIEEPWSENRRRNRTRRNQQIRRRWEDEDQEEDNKSYIKDMTSMTNRSRNNRSRN